VLTSAIKEATAASAPKRRSQADPRPPLPAGIQDETRLKKQLKRQWQDATDPALKAQVNRLQRPVAYRQKEWRNEHWSDTLDPLDSEDHLLWKMTKTLMQVSTLSPSCKCREDYLLQILRKRKP
jgi:hypothetical protein